MFMVGLYVITLQKNNNKFNIKKNYKIQLLNEKKEQISLTHV